MATQKDGKNTRIILFFAGFVLLFVLAFSLGVIIGKGVSGTKYVETKTEPSADVSVTEQDTDSFTIDDEPESAETVEPPDIAESEEPPPQKDLKLKEDIEVNEEEVATTVEKIAPEPEKPSDIMSEELELNEKSPTSESKKVASADPPEETTKTEVASRSGKSEEVPASAPLPRTDPGGNFTVQLGSFKNREMAIDLEKKMNAKGYPSFTRKVTIPDQGEWYRVRIGTFKDKSTAKQYADLLVKKEKSLKSVYVTTND